MFFWIWIIKSITLQKKKYFSTKLHFEMSQQVSLCLYGIFSNVYCSSYSHSRSLPLSLCVSSAALPKAPGTPVVTERTATSITLTWDSGNPEPVSYYVIQVGHTHTHTTTPTHIHTHTHTKTHTLQVKPGKITAILQHNQSEGGQRG